MKTVSQIAWSIRDSIRSNFGLEDGLDLILIMLYIRSVSDGQKWLEFRNNIIYAKNGSDVIRDKIDESIPNLLQREYIPIPPLEGGDQARNLIDSIESAVMDAEVSILSLFEDLLTNSEFSEYSGNTETATPEKVADFMVSLIATEGTFYDPACGSGSLLLEAHRHGARLVVGTEISHRALLRSAMRLEMQGANYELYLMDSLTNLHSMRAMDRKFDAIAVHPPFGSKLVTHQLDGIFGWSRNQIKRSNGDEAWLELVFSLVGDRGKAAILLPPGLTFRGGASERIRQLIIESDVLEGLVSMSPRSLPATVLAPTLWLLNPSKSVRGRFVVVDIEMLRHESRNPRRSLEAETLAEARELILQWRHSGRINAPEFSAIEVSNSAALTTDAQPRRFLAARPQEIVEQPSAPVRLLSEIRIDNLKSFDKESSAKLAPITLFYGANSAGKSTIIQSINLIKQSLQGGGELVTQGSITNAGSFLGILNRHSDMSKMALGISFGAPEESAFEDIQTVNPAWIRSVDWKFQADSLGQGRLINFSLKLDRINQASGIAVDLSKSQISDKYRDSIYGTPAKGLSPLLGHIGLGGLLNPTIGVLNFPKSESVIQRSRTTTRQIDRIIDRLFQADPMLYLEFDGLLPSSIHSNTRREWSLLNDREAGKYLNAVESVVTSVGAETTRILSDLVYLGPLRSIPERFYNRESTNPSLPLEGSHFANHLYDISSDRSAVNEWLHRLDVPYSVDIVSVTAADRALYTGDLISVVLTDTRSGVKVSPTDVGFGVSQVLPIVAEAVARRNSVICIEQPEIHLHPALQGRLADLFIESSQQENRGNQFIIETHSEHLILRLQRRIREGELDPSLVAVNYVDQSPDGRTRVQEVRLDADGDFIDAWPGGFFEERLDDILGDWS